MSDPTPVDPTPTPEPVVSVEWWKSAVLGGITAISTVLMVFNAWNPTKEQLVAIGGLASWLVPLVFILVGYFVRGKVTPVSTAARAVDKARAEGHAAALAQVAALAPASTADADAAFVAQRQAQREQANAALLNPPAS